MENPPANSSSPVIEMNEVAFGTLQDVERVVMENVNWKVAPGEYWVVGGMHGSGKRDLISLTAGLMPPLRGTYRLFGSEMPLYGDEQLAQRLRLGMVFDNGNLLHQLNVHENLALPLRYHRDLGWQEIEERVKTMLELAELTPFEKTMPGALDHHWQKRAGLARALMLEPEVLLVDHALSGLDFRQSNWFLKFFDQLSAGHEFCQKRPMTLIATAEDLRPWRNPHCHFAFVKEKQLFTVGHRPQLTCHPEPLVKELLAEPFTT
ncbi:MAG TPA: ATP-binding cassette domain-containing protein [Verrucomicrobiae bacterium]|jgi:ABC-type transporter Mla maintaining outer membrane lipid asymmetry ATPase subunit MlaF|nr:ATP-binding cassette domain-containing protein [Verrucomicrobiae bacterium]